MDVAYPIILSLDNEPLRNELYLYGIAQGLLKSKTKTELLSSDAHQTGLTQNEHDENFVRNVIDEMDPPDNSFGARMSRLKHKNSLLYTAWHRTFAVCNFPPDVTEAVKRWAQGLLQERNSAFSFRHREKLGQTLAPYLSQEGEDFEEFKFCSKRVRIFGANKLHISRIHENYDVFGYLMVFILPVIYGACHATAWSSHFPTLVEQLLWRISTITVMPSGLIVYVVLRIIDWVDDNQDESWFSVAIYLLVVLLFFGFFLAFIMSRGFLVVESFISMRSLPKGSYDTVEWSNYWPHF